MLNKDDTRRAARDLGFDLCGFARAGRAPHADALGHWLEAGCHAGMEWMKRTAALRADPRLVLPGARTVIALATNYFVPAALPADAPSGVVARYARGGDYHGWISPRLEALAAALQRAGGDQKCFVDAGPVLERDWAVAAGICWHGKSTMGIHPRLGTWFFLSAILTTLDFEPDAPLPDRCGRCTRCIAACPTRAITAPRLLDARRCLSYLTIENKGPIPEKFRPALGARIFGCDDCLGACPWNRFARASQDANLRHRSSLDRPLRDFLRLDDAGFRALFRSSPILRAKRRGFLRNVCVALGNTGCPDDLAALRRALDDPEPLVREHAAWAVKRIEAAGAPARSPAALLDRIEEPRDRVVPR